MTSRCPDCNEPVLEADTDAGEPITVDLNPDRIGTVMILNGGAAFLDGPLLMEARRAGIPLFSRHRIKCRGFWLRHRGGLADDTKELIGLLHENGIRVTVGGISDHGARG